MKLVVILLLAAMLTGCSRTTVYETVNDEAAQSASASPREILFDLAEEPGLPAMGSDRVTLYLQNTVKEVSGFAPEELTLIQTGNGEVDRYEFVWTSATDFGQQIGRAAVLDDGNYHYILSATVDAELIEEYQEIWNGIFESFQLAQY